jgi:hypothetical protein
MIARLICAAAWVTAPSPAMARRRRRRRGSRPALRRLLLLVAVGAVSVVLHREGCLRSGDATRDDGYDRAAWPHWIDEDGDCQDTRQEVLVAESEVPVVFADDARCKVKSGRWRCPYTGRMFEDPHELDVDHLVPLRAAHAAGGDAWTRDRRRAFANALDDAGHLVAVDASANRQKGHQGPDRWLPAAPAARCDYVRAWLRIKERWALALPPPERAAIDDAVARCNRGQVPARPG